MANALDILEQAQAQLVSQQAEMLQETNDAVAKMNAASGKESELNTQIQQQQIKDNNRAIEVGQVLAKALGADPSAANYRLESLAKQKAASTDEAIRATDEYNQLQQTSFLDNPLMYVLNQFASDKVASQANAATIKSQLATKEMQDINNEIQSGAVTAKIVSQTVNQDLTAKQLELASLGNQRAAAALLLEGVKTRSEGLKAVLSGNASLIDIEQHKEAVVTQHQQMAQAERHFQTNAAMAEKHYQLSVAQFEEMKKEHGIANDFKEQKQMLAQAKFDTSLEDNANDRILKLEKAAQDAEKAGKKTEAAQIRSQLTETKKQFELDKAIAERDATIDIVNKYKQAAEFIGVSDRIFIPDDPRKAEQVINAGLKDKSATGNIFRLMQANVNSMTVQEKLKKDGKPIIMLGRMPTEAVQNYQLIQPSGLRPEQYELANDVIKQVNIAKQKLQGQPGMSAHETEDAVNSAVFNEYIAKIDNPESSDLTRLPTLPQLTKFESILGHPIYQKYILPDIEANKADSKFETIMGYIQKALDDKVVNFNQAAEFGSKLYAQAISYNNSKYGYSTMALPKLQDYKILGIGERPLNAADITDFKTIMLYKQKEGLFNIVGNIPFIGNKLVADEKARLANAAARADYSPENETKKHMSKVIGGSLGN